MSDHDKSPGIISWNELFCEDTEASTKFYTELFGWGTQEMPMPDGQTYRMFTAGERPVAGFIGKPDNMKGAPTMWMGYITVEDVSAALAKAKALGATVVTDQVDMPMGSFAVISDPEGGTFGLWQFNEGAEGCD